MNAVNKNLPVKNTIVKIQISNINQMIADGGTSKVRDVESDESA